MQNPFESGHIKNYILLYASVVIIMVLFFIASTLFHDVKEVDKKIFNTRQGEEVTSKSLVESNQGLGVGRLEESTVNKQSQTNKFRLLEKAY